MTDSPANVLPFAQHYGSALNCPPTDIEHVGSVALPDRCANLRSLICPLAIAKLRGQE